MAQWLHAKDRKSKLLHTQEEIDEALADGYGYEADYEPNNLNYTDKTIDELRELAKEKNIKGAHNAKRSTLIKKLGELND